MQSQEIKDKVKNTNLERYGVESAMQLEEVRNKHKKTCLERYGCENISQSQEFKDNLKNIFLEKFGVTNSLKSGLVRNKIKETCLKKYGTNHYLETQEFKDKSRITCLEIYGANYPMQNAEYSENHNIKSKRWKTYTFPDKTEIKVQGYEPFAIDELIKDGYEMNDIITKRTGVPEIWYTLNDKQHRYYVDIYVPSINKMIEVKSNWTIKCNYDIIILKAKACIKKGFVFEIWVYDEKGNKEIKLI